MVPPKQTIRHDQMMRFVGSLIAAMLFGFTVPHVALAQNVSAFVPIEITGADQAKEADTGTIRLPEKGGTLGIYLSPSIDGIDFFRIDLDASVDSSGDSVTDNDADNTFHSSYHTGTSFPASIRATTGEMQRTIKVEVIRGGLSMGSAALRIVFDPMVSPDSVFPSVRIALGDGRTQDAQTQTNTTAIVAQPADPVMGQQFSLTVTNPPSGVTLFAWDLQGDGVTDTETSEPTVLLSPDAPGILPVRVTLKDAEGNDISIISGAFTVSSDRPTDTPPSTSPLSVNSLSGALRIDATVLGLTVELKPKLDAPLDLLYLEPTWHFGDEEKSFLLEPVHTYDVAGSYTVMLSLRDTRTGQEVASTESTVTVTSVPAQTGGTANQGIFSGILSSIFFILKVTGFILALLIVIALCAFSYFFLQARAQNLTLSEVIGGFRSRLMGEEPIVDRGRDDAQDSDDVIDIEPAIAEPAPMPMREEKRVELKDDKTPSAPRTPESKHNAEENALPPWLMGTTQEKTIVNPDAVQFGKEDFKKTILQEATPISTLRPSGAEQAEPSVPPGSDQKNLSSPEPAPIPPWLKHGLEVTKEVVGDGGEGSEEASSFVKATEEKLEEKKNTEDMQVAPLLDDAIVAEIQAEVREDGDEDVTKQT